MSVKHISSDDVAMVLEGILYGDDAGFEEALESGYTEIEAFAEAMREANQVYTIANFDNKGG